MSYTRDVAVGSIYLFIGSILAAIFAYATKLILVRNLTVEEYGLFFAVFTFVLFFVIFRELGFSQGLVRFITEYRLKNQFGKIKSVVLGTFLIQLIASIIIVSILWIISDFLAIHYFESEDAKILLRILIFYIPLSILQIQINAIFLGFKSKLYAFSQATFNFILLFLVIIVLQNGLVQIAWVHILVFLLFSLLFSYFVLQKVRFFLNKADSFIAENKKIILFSYPILLGSTGGVILAYFDTLMITYFDTLANVGIYNIIFPSAFLISIIGNSVITILFPVVSELVVKKDTKKIQNSFVLIYKYLAILIFPILFFILYYSKDIIRVFFGADFISGSVPFQIILFGVLFFMLNSLNLQVISAFKQTTVVMKTYVFGGILNVILNLFLIPPFSITGAAIATLVSYIFMFFFSLTHLKKFVTPKVKIFQIIQIVILSFVAILIPIIASKIVPISIYISVIFGFGIGLIVYVIALYIFKVLTFSEIRGLFIK